jgi:flagellum-specific peptidoglycan hydrolase FlgJ
MRKITYLFIGLVFFTSCSAHKKTISNRQARRNNQAVQKSNSASIAGYVPLTSLQYIDRYKAIAVQEMNLYGIPASITLAQGLFESGSGNGELARVANNHFGIKCTPNWDGKTYYKDDDNPNDCFRVYDKAEDSFRDHSLFLKKRKNYAGLFDLDPTDYKGWAKGLKKAGYATNPNYPSILIGIIQKYNLDQYDNPQSGTGNKPDTVFVKKDPDNLTTPPDTTLPNAQDNKSYIVKQGDTLYNISKRFGLTVDDLKTLNNLTDANIKIGQKLVVAKQ